MKCLGQQFCAVWKTFCSSSFSESSLQLKTSGLHEAGTVLIFFSAVYPPPSHWWECEKHCTPVFEKSKWMFLIPINDIHSGFPCSVVEASPLVLKYPRLKFVHLVPGNHEAQWKRMQISEHKCVLLLPEVGQFPSNMQLKMKRWKLDGFLYFANFFAFFVRTGALQG